LTNTPEGWTQQERAIDTYVRKHPQLGQFGAGTALLDAAIRVAAHRPGLAVDIGCGEGRTLASLKERLGPDRLIGIDLSVHRARIVASLGFKSVVADGHKLPITDKSTSLVLCRHVIEHVESDDLLVSDMRRILHEDGVLYLETPLRKRGAWYFYRNNDGRRVLDPTHAREYGSVRELEEVLTRNGLTPIELNVGPITFPLTHILYRVFSGNRSPSIRVIGLLERKTVNLRVPRYAEIQVLARRSVPGDSSLNPS
jgi:ubiquinone/menaquinone biosynthesis C-methylase UbiE